MYGPQTGNIYFIFNSTVNMKRINHPRTLNIYHYGRYTVHSGAWQYPWAVKTWAPMYTIMKCTYSPDCWVHTESVRFVAKSLTLQGNAPHFSFLGMIVLLWLCICVRAFFPDVTWLVYCIPLLTCTYVTWFDLLAYDQNWNWQTGEDNLNLASIQFLFVPRHDLY